MMVASLGPALAVDMGLAPALADEERDRLNFGEREPLVALMQETPVERLLPILVNRWKCGTDLAELVAAAALANARTFGGEDYTGYHAFMALAPAFAMAAELPKDRGALPVLKVLYRNTRRIQECGGRKNEVLRRLPASDANQSGPAELDLRDATRRADMDLAERTFARLARGPIGEAYRHLQFSIEDEVDVHRVVLAWRAWEILDLAGREQAGNLLRQSVRYCVKEEQQIRRRGREPEVRVVVPKLLDQYRLVGRKLGNREADTDWIEKLAQIVYRSSRAQAADAAAAALAEGMASEAVGEAISLAANRLVLCDPGRTREQASPGKPAGSVHGASVGVHASDAANAWRNIARVSDNRTAAASLIVAAYHTAGQSRGQLADPHPGRDQFEAIKTSAAPELLLETATAIKAHDQARACALVHRYGQLGYSPKPVFHLLLQFAVSEDGALHAEKYYKTVSEEFARSQPAFQWRHLTALARVTASEFGYPAPGYLEACRLLNSVGAS
jgi:hypothetical protein